MNKFLDGPDEQPKETDDEQHVDREELFILPPEPPTIFIEDDPENA